MTESKESHLAELHIQAAYAHTAAAHCIAPAITHPPRSLPGRLWDTPRKP